MGDSFFVVVAPNLNLNFCGRQDESVLDSFVAELVGDSNTSDGAYQTYQPYYDASTHGMDSAVELPPLDRKQAERELKEKMKINSRRKRQ